MNFAILYRGLFQRLCGNEVRSIAGEKRRLCVCFWLDLSFLSRFWKANHRSPLCSSLSNGRRTSPSLSYHSFPLSSELRKHCLVALRRDDGANSRVSESIVLCSGRFLRKIFTFLLMPKSLGTPITDHGKARKASRFLKVDAVPSVFFFCFFLRPQVSVRRSQMEWVWTTKQREARPWEKACSWLPLAKWWNHSIESWRNARGCSASEVKSVKDPPIERPKCDVGQHAVCIRTSETLNRIAEKVNQYLSGCVPVDEKYSMGHNKQERKRKEKEVKEKKKKKKKTKKDLRWRCRWR